jgi:hypothetical protein
VLVRERERDERPKMDGKAFPKGLLTKSGDFVDSGDLESCRSSICWSGSWRFEKDVSKRLLLRFGRDECGAESRVVERDNATPERPDATEPVGVGIADDAELFQLFLLNRLVRDDGAAVLFGLGIRADQRRRFLTELSDGIML